MNSSSLSITVLVLGVLFAMVILGLRLRGRFQRSADSNPLPSPSTSGPHSRSHSRSRFTASPSSQLRLQVTLILGPVLLLAAGGFYSLSRDRAQLQSQAIRQAEVHAQDLANRLIQPWAAELSMIELLGNQWNGDGMDASSTALDPGAPNLRAKGSDTNAAEFVRFARRYPDTEFAEIFPTQLHFEIDTPLSSLPQPAAWRDELRSDTRRLWDQLETAASQPIGTNQFKQWEVQFQSVQLPPALQANLAFLRLRSAASVRPSPSTRAPLAEALVQFALDPENRWVNSPAGLPISAVALGQALKLGEPGQFNARWLEALRQQVHQTPSIITPQLLAAAVPLVAPLDPAWRKALDELSTRWRSRERQQSLVRHLQGATALESQMRTNIWIDFQGSRWLVLVEPRRTKAPETQAPLHQNSPPTPTARAFSHSILSRSLELALQSIPNRLPPWLSAEVSIEGVRMHPRSSWISPTNPLPNTLLASHSVPLHFSLPNPGHDQVEDSGANPTIAIRLFLSDPQALFANQRLRFWLFTGFLLATTGTSVLGVRQAVRTLRKQAELADQKSNFVSSVSHELRAPIASVRLLAESLERGAAGGPERQKEYHQLIVAECRRLSALVENVLDATRIDQGRTQFEFEPTDLLRLTQEAFRLMSPLAREAGTQLIGDWPTPGLPPTPWPTPSLDGHAVLRALLNLVDNAIKHSPPHSQIQLRMEFVPSQSTHPTALRWIVQDQGPGVPHEERQRIFDRFHRLGSELRRETPGVGLGLAIVRHTAGAHHGKVWVEDGPSGGSQFILEIPLSPCRES